MQASIELLTRLGHPVAEIQRSLERDERFVGRVPGYRTVQRIAAEVNLPDGSGTWHPIQADPEEAALVLPVLARVIEVSKGKIREFTNDQARYIARVRLMVPDLPLYAAFQAAESYQHLLSRGTTTNDLDAFLAFAPWRDDQAERRLKWARKNGWLPDFHVATLLVEFGIMEDFLIARWPEFGTDPENADLDESDSGGAEV